MNFPPHPAMPLLQLLSDATDCYRAAHTLALEWSHPGNALPADVSARILEYLQQADAIQLRRPALQLHWERAGRPGHDQVRQALRSTQSAIEALQYLTNSQLQHLRSQQRQLRRLSDSANEKQQMHQAYRRSGRAAAPAY